MCLFSGTEKCASDNTDGMREAAEERKTATGCWGAEESPL